MTRLITANASKVSGAQFLDAFLGPYEPKRQETFEQCIRLIEVGADLYGYPPALIEHCKAIIAERALAPVHRDIDPETGNDRIAA